MPRRNNNQMTVGELKEILNDYPDETKVMFSYNYRDNCQTQVCKVPEQQPYIQSTVWSDYFNMYRITEEESEKQDEALIL